MKTIALIIMVAIVLEALVEYAKTIMKMVEDKDYKTAITQFVTIILGIGLAYAFKLQLFNGAMTEFYEGLEINPILDMVLTGILFSRGSNYFSDFVSKLQGKDKQQTIVSVIDTMQNDIKDIKNDFNDMFYDDVDPATEQENDAIDEQAIDYTEAESMDDDETGRG